MWIGWWMAASWNSTSIELSSWSYPLMALTRPTPFHTMKREESRTGVDPGWKGSWISTFEKVKVS